MTTPLTPDLVAYIAELERDGHSTRVLGPDGALGESPYPPDDSRDRAWLNGWNAARVHLAQLVDDHAAAIATIPRPTGDERYAARIAEMEEYAAEYHAARGTQDWPGIENMTLAQRRLWWNRTMSDWNRHATTQEAA